MRRQPPFLSLSNVASLLSVLALPGHYSSQSVESKSRVEQRIMVKIFEKLSYWLATV